VISVCFGFFFESGLLRFMGDCWANQCGRARSQRARVALGIGGLWEILLLFGGRGISYS